MTAAIETDRLPAALSENLPAERRRFVSWIVLAVPLIIVLAGAWSYRWVQEDAFINVRIIGNLVAGHGPVFNVGERVETYSDPLWLFLLAGLHEVTPFVSLEWLSVVLGLAGTACGVLLAGRAIQRLGEARGSGLVLPAGLLIFSVVAGVWEFSTGGLEMGMVFCWIGLSFWLLVRTEGHRTSATSCAFVIGLGTLIRPELILMSLVELATLGLVVASPGWQGPVSVRQRYFKPLFAAICLPVLYELWRMAYFGLLVPNTALAKSSTAGWWNQGLTYLWNFVSPYTLWLPFIFAIPLVVPKLRRWWVSGDHIGSIVLLTPVIAALADTLYVVHLGGDFMHARLLLPAFLSLCVPIYIEIAELRTLLLVPVSVIVVWSVICGGWLRMGSGWAPGGYVTFIHGIANERNVWIYDTGIQHPISVADYAKFTAAGEEYNKAAKVASSQGQQTMLVVIDPNVPWGPKVVAAKSGLPFSFVVDFNNIGVDGVVAGPQVYLFDNLSLANPIGSHTVLPARGRPGHEKFVDPAWMVARFSLPGEQFPPGGPTGQDIAAARKALTCNPLRSYLHGITGSLSFSQAISNITHSFTYTRMSYSTNPIQTEQELCR